MSNVLKGIAVSLAAGIILAGISVAWITRVFSINPLSFISWSAALVLIGAAIGAFIIERIKDKTQSNPNTTNIVAPVEKGKEKAQLDLMETVKNLPKESLAILEDIYRNGGSGDHHALDAHVVYLQKQRLIIIPLIGTTTLSTCIIPSHVMKLLKENEEELFCMVQTKQDRRVPNIVSNAVRIPPPEIAYGVIACKGFAEAYDTPDKKTGQVISKVIHGAPVRIYEIRSIWVNTEHGWMEKDNLKMKLGKMAELENHPETLEHMQAKARELLDEE